jgi:hypothetical protein
MTWAYINSLISQVPTLYDMGIYKLTPLPSKSIAAPLSIHAHIVVSPSPRSTCLPAIIHISQSPLSSTSPHAATASTPSLHDNAGKTPVVCLLFSPPPPPSASYQQRHLPPTSGSSGSASIGDPGGMAMAITGGERKVEGLLAAVAVIAAHVTLGLDDVGSHNIHSSPTKIR